MRSARALEWLLLAVYLGCELTAKLIDQGHCSISTYICVSLIRHSAASNSSLSFGSGTPVLPRDHVMTIMCQMILCTLQCSTLDHAAGPRKVPCFDWHMVRLLSGTA